MRLKLDRRLVLAERFDQSSMSCLTVPRDSGKLGRGSAGQSVGVAAKELGLMNLHDCTLKFTTSDRSIGRGTLMCFPIVNDIT